MIEAFLRGKLSVQQENMEDLWTSCVFGSLRLLPPSSGILPFLAQARSWKDETTLILPVESDDRSEIEYQFWPTLEGPGTHRCEPDLLIRLRPTQQLFLVEAKLHSGKSTEADGGERPYDQLAREWDNLLAISGNFEPVLVYLTADRTMPRESIAQSVKEFTQKRPQCIEPRIFWLSWQHLSGLPRDNGGVISGLNSMLARLDLLAFDGWTDTVSSPKFSFQVSPTLFAWNDALFDNPWNFSRSGGECG
jgi:hypothetical protein